MLIDYFRHSSFGFEPMLKLSTLKVSMLTLIIKKIDDTQYNIDF